LLPLVLYISVAFFVDPFSIIHSESNSRIAAVKAEIASRLNYPLFKLQRFTKNPSEIILLGDSRTDKLSVLVFENLTKQRVTNLAYGGGTIPEIVTTFWYSIQNHNIKEVYIGLNFNMYNKGINMNRVPEAIRLKNSPLSYIFSKYCFKSIYRIITSFLTDEQIDIEKPNLNKSEFWQYQLESTITNFYKYYQYPDSFASSLSEISKYCHKNNIKLTFIIPPTHTDLQNKIIEYELEEQELRFKQDISELGILYDYDFPNTLTTNRENFSDPFHFKDSIANIMVRELVTKKFCYARTNSLVKRK